MKYYYVFCLSMALFFNSAGTGLCERKALIDEGLKSHDEKIKTEMDACAIKEKNILKILDCEDKIRERYHNASIRGKERYCQENYYSLSFEELDALWKKLKNQKDGARRSSDIYRGKREPGEVTAEMIEIEILHVESELARRQQKKSLINREALQQGKGPHSQ